MDEAKADAARGWPVLPCKGKVPATPHGVKDASLDQEKITAWFGNGATHNVGIATGEASGLLVLDVDPRHGGDTSLEALIDQHGELPTTPDAAKGGLEAACAAIKDAPFGQQEDALNTQCLRVGRAVAKGTYRFDFALAHLCRAGRDMANEPGKAPWKPGDIDKKIVRGLSDGIANTRGGGTVDRGDVDDLPPITIFSAARWEDEEPEPPTFTITDLAPAGCLVNVAGLAGTGKSILLQTAATCLAVGLPFLGKETAAGAAAYFGFEDPDGVLLHRQSRINDLLGIPHPKDLYIKSYLGHDLTLFEDGKFTDRLPWLLAQIDSIEGLAAVFLDPGSDVYCDNFYDPVLVKRFCRVLTIEAFKREITIFLGLHTAKASESQKTPFGSMQWLGATRATLVLDHVQGEDGKPSHDEAVLRVHKGNYMRPGEEIELLWQDGLLVPKGEPDAYERLAQLKELNQLILRLVDTAWQSAAPLSDNRSIGDRYLPAKVVQASKGKFTRKEVQEQLSELLRLGQLELTHHYKSRRLGLKVTNPKLQNRGEDDT